MYSTDAFSGILCCWKASMISFNHCLSSELWNIPLLKGLQQFLSLQKAHLVLTKKKAHEMPSRKKATKKFVVSFPIISYWQIQLSFEKVIKVLFLDTRQNNSLLQQLQNCITASGKTGHDCRSEKKKAMKTTHTICYLQTGLHVPRSYFIRKIPVFMIKPPNFHN